MFPKPFFVMIWNQKATRLIPLLDENDELVMFSSIGQACHVADKVPTAQAFGYDVFEAGSGVAGEDGAR